MEQVGFRILPRRDTDRALVALFEGLPASIISDNLSRMTGAFGLAPYHRPGVQLLGTALTVRTRPGDNLMIHKALQLGRPGDVLVIDGGGTIERALFGDIMKNVAKMRGFTGVVIDGAIRDAAAYREDSFPCYARGVCHRGPYKDGPGEINVPVCIGGMAVNPGDIVVGDQDGLLAFAASEAALLIECARAQHAREEATMQAIRERRWDRSFVDALEARAAN